MRRSRFIWPLPLIILCVCLAVCKPLAKAQAPAAGFNLVWNRPVATLSALSLSPQGQRIAMLTGTGKVAVWSAADGSPLWSQNNNARAIAVTDGLGYVLAYDPLDPLNSTLTLLASGGNAVWKHRLDGPIWAVAVSHDGAHAAISTGRDTIYGCTLQPQPICAPWHAAGICESLAYAPNDDYLVAGLWNQSGVACFGMDGKQVWNVPGQSDRRYDAFVVPGSRYILSIDYVNHKTSDGSVTLLNASDGQAIWTFPLGENSYDCSVLAGPDAQTTVASFVRIQRRGRTFSEPRRLIALDHLGNRVWDKGGLFFSPVPICMAPQTGGVVVYDQSRTLYMLDSNGDIVNHAQLSGLLRLWAVSDDDRELLVYTGDGQLSLYRLG